MRLLSTMFALCVFVLPLPSIAQVASPVASITLSTPDAALRNWLALRTAIHEGKPYGRSLRALQFDMPAHITRSDAWRVLRKNAKFVSPSREILQITLQNLTAPKPDITKQKPSTLSDRFYFQLKKHLEITPEEKAATERLHAALYAHAEAGELMAAARLIREANAQGDLAAWAARYEKRRALLLALAQVERALAGR